MSNRKFKGPHEKIGLDNQSCSTDPLIEPDPMQILFVVLLCSRAQ
jgi:hypothetical protein